MSKRESVQELLSKNVDPDSELFWKTFQQAILRSDNSPFDRRGILNLKILFTNDQLTPTKVGTLAKLLMYTGQALGSNFAQDLGEIFNEIFFSDKDPTYNEAFEFASALRNLCVTNTSIKLPIFEAIFENFTHFLSKHPNVSSITISQIFLLEIALITGKDCAKQSFTQKGDPLCITGAIKILESVSDSTVQITITEWIWRSMKLVDPKQKVFPNALGKYSGIYDISKTDFRTSLHNFVTTLNDEVSSTSPLHIPFKSMSAGNTIIHCSGCFDVNTDNVAIFFYERPKELPDVIIFRTNYITSGNVNKTAMTFESREKVSGFQGVGESSPTKFSISFETKPGQDVTKEYLRRIKNNKMTRTSDDIQTPQRSRVNADKEKPDTRGIKLPTKSPGSRERKQNEMAMIEAQLKEYHDSSIRAIETDFNSSVSALNDITEKLTGIESSLTQLLSQHEDITKATTKSNEELSKSITRLRKDFETNHADAMKKRENLKKMAIDAINSENSKIVKTTAEGFQYNAIVGLAAALDSVQSLIV